ncbi:leucyl/phenylalanyl-tRNA--protein transferase [Salinispira pacifica]|uniref:Leucyl/phenylalanyl-tRNA--protein transferase n=1 Tax=Salinispira pacifica TaxID=1307761 RepID=V5WGN7_9SPIO|nr:leucyl/phenylalanyl-tRNA--protein transferase [Salinispira pacifica]AHC14790.1 Leucyl/phenylalanyl-tRNA--protein transferase [Salinispira pacifica]
MYDFSSIEELSHYYRITLPDPGDANPQGILGVGGNLSPGLLLSAYEQGIFPWFSESDPILWWSPDPRCVFHPADIHISSRNRRMLKKSGYVLNMDRDFSGVIRHCAKVARKDEDGTWITPEMIAAYTELHRLGYAHSAEVYADGELVGGLYGVSRGRIFCGESMFSLEPNASKFALAGLARFLHRSGCSIIDSQVENPHILSLGARNIPRDQYLAELSRALKYPDIQGWGEVEYRALNFFESWKPLTGDSASG